MRRQLTWLQAGLLSALAGVVALVATSAPVTTHSTGTTQGVPALLRAGSCYRFTFPVAGSPNWKVLEVLDNGWVKAEIDAGPASALREPVWVNTAQIITARDAKCSA